VKKKIEDIFKEQNRLPGRCFQSERDHEKELKHQLWIVDDHQMLLVCSNWHRGISEHFPLLVETIIEETLRSKQREREKI